MPQPEGRSLRDEHSGLTEKQVQGQFPGTGRSQCSQSPGSEDGGKERKRGVERPGGRAFPLEEGAWVLNPSRKPVEGYVEEQADGTFKRSLWLLCGRRIYRIGRSGSRESSEGEVLALVLSQGGCENQMK